MTNEDRAAAEELATEMNYTEATKFLRSESSGSMMAAIKWARGVAQRHPESALAESLAKFDAQRTHVEVEL